MSASPSPAGRKSRLNAAMQKKATVTTAAVEEEPVDSPAQAKAALSLAPTPTEEETPQGEVTPTTTAEQEPRESAPDAVEEVSAEEVPEDLIAENTSLPEIEGASERIVDSAPAAVSEVAPRTPTADSAPAGKPLAQKAQVLAGVGQIRIEDDMVHLRRLIESGRDQRRYVEDLPRISDKGTYLRLPIHLKDVLGEYCDRNVAPMADFIAALLDSYFRDIGILPPLGEGHRPNEKALDKIRKESRSYDY
jgi:hypothetical protein